MQGGEEQDPTSDICLLQDFPRGGSGRLGVERPVPRSWACRIARLLTLHPLPLEELFWRVAGDRGSGKFSESAMLCNCFPFWNSRGQWFAGATALFKHRELKFLFHHQHILSADSAWATHKRVANPDSYPLSQEECMLILTRGQRSQPRSELLSGPTRWWEADRIQSSQREQQRKEQVSALESEGGCASSAMCFLYIVKWRFGCDQTPQVANVLIPSSSLCAQHSSRSFGWMN